MIENERIKDGYGLLPEVIGKLYIKNDESMLYLCTPIKLKYSGKLAVPPQLERFQPLIRAVIAREPEVYSKYIYITVKAMYVSGRNTGQRAGWHCDGFMTEDINYIWSDNIPTIFGSPYYDSTGWRDYLSTVALPQDHDTCLKWLKEKYAYHETKYHNNTLLRLDQYVIHKPQEVVAPTFRTFVKISVSDHIYALQGNTKNPMLPETLEWEYKPRVATRNCPTGRR